MSEPGRGPVRGRRSALHLRSVVNARASEEATKGASEQTPGVAAVRDDNLRPLGPRAWPLYFIGLLFSLRVLRFRSRATLPSVTECTFSRSRQLPLGAADERRRKGELTRE